MKTRKRFSRSNLLSLIVFTAAPVLTVADDTDIYLAAESSGDSRSQYESNVLFIIDTSASMGDGKIGEYNPEIDYIQELDDLGIARTCERGKMYRTTAFGGRTHDGTPSGNFITGHGVSCSDSLMFYTEDLDCRAANDVAETINIKEHGFYVDQVQEFTGSTWQNLSSNGPTNRRKVSCRADSGRMVEGAIDQSEYLADSTANGWSTDRLQELDWTANRYKFHIIYSANYLAWRNDYIRIEVLNRVFKNTINDLNTGNIGVMRFSHGSGGQGGMVIHAMDHISSTKSALVALADDHFTVNAVDGATPLAETMWEAYNYYSGSRVDTGDDSEPDTSVPASRDPSDSDFYKTPIQKACQKNFIVYLSDGEADADELRDDEIRNLTGSTCSYGSDESGDNCLDDLAAWMSQNDITPDIGAGTEQEIQTVTTHTIGFGIDTQLLRDTATGSGGRYFSASSASDLNSAFEDILREVTADSGSFTPPAVSVNAFSRLMHRDDLYFTLFKPSVNSHWDGNLKKYRLKKINGALKIVDTDNAPAVNSIDGTFKHDTRSFWTPATETDGDDIAKGGAAANLKFTLQNGQRRPRTALPASDDISNAINAVDETNEANITKTLLDIDAEDAAYHVELLKWIRGVDKHDYDTDGDTSEPRLRLGDPLHTQPVIVTYGGTDAAPDITVFMTTNDGFLHAIDAETGEEQAAYIPAELLKNQKLAFDESLSPNKLYGLDGGITPWINDANRNGKIETGEHVYLYIGMRRGGSSYYALDVTNRNSPKLMWQINGGDAGFEQLGQSWSKPALATIKIDAEKKKVLIFGGGFDNGGNDGASEDDLLSPAEHDIGNAIFIVDATDGTLLYSASNQASSDDRFDDMDFAIPSDLTVVDVNTDGVHDRIYVGDLGGQLWRFDIANGQSGAALVDGAVVAKLGRTAAGAAAEDRRRFFNRPDVSLIADELNGTFLSIAIGSGRRNEPTDNDIQDRFFSIWDKNVYTRPVTYPAAVTPADLHDATDNLIAEGTTVDGGTQQQAADELAAGKGWFIDLEHGDAAGKGEKSLATSITLDNQILFTTYVPAGSQDPDSCEAGTGSGRFYAVKVATAEPATHFEWADSGVDDDPTKNDRSKRLARSGIPSSPIVLFPEANDGEATVLAGTEIQDIPLRQRTRKTYWYVDED